MAVEALRGPRGVSTFCVERNVSRYIPPSGWGISPNLRTSSMRRPYHGIPLAATSGMARKIRYAIVGQGYFAQRKILPAFAHARKNSERTALFSDDPVKLKRLSRRYGAEHALGYDQYD